MGARRAIIGGMRVLVLALGLAVVGGAPVAACGGDVEPNYGPADGLVGRQPPPAGTAPSSSGSSSGGAASSSGSGSGSSSGGTASGSSSGATGDGGTTGGDGGQMTMACQVSWANTVYPMLNSTGAGHCSSSNCHATGAGGVTLDDGATKMYGQLAQALVGAKPLVKPNDTNAADSSIVCVLQGTCGAQMPTGFPALTGPQIGQVQTWVQCGSPQN